MAEKDMTEKTLEAFNDVFADIINGLLFNGEQVLRQESFLIKNVDQKDHPMGHRGEVTSFQQNHLA